MILQQVRKALKENSPQTAMDIAFSIGEEKKAVTGALETLLDMGRVKHFSPSITKGKSKCASCSSLSSCTLYESV